MTLTGMTRGDYMQLERMATLASEITGGGAGAAFHFPFIMSNTGNPLPPETKITFISTVDLSFTPEGPKLIVKFRFTENGADKVGYYYISFVNNELVGAF